MPKSPGRRRQKPPAVPGATNGVAAGLEPRAVTPGPGSTDSGTAPSTTAPTSAPASAPASAQTPTAARVAIAAPGEEPVWLVRLLLVLFLLGFSAFLAQEVARVMGIYP